MLSSHRNFSGRGLSVTSSQAGISLGAVPIPLAFDVPGLGAEDPATGRAPVFSALIFPLVIVISVHMSQGRVEPSPLQMEAHVQFPKISCMGPTVFPVSSLRASGRRQR